MNRREFLALTSLSVAGGILPRVSRYAAAADVETGMTELDTKSYEETQNTLF